MKTARTIIALIAGAFMTGAIHCQAQLPGAKPEGPIEGAFLVSVDDHATIFVNGAKVFHANLGRSRSPNTALKAGDQIVVRLANDRGPRGFLLVFVSTDGQKIVSFRSTDFKIVPEVGVTNFTPEQFQKWPKNADKKQGDKAFDHDVKNYSDRVWGDLDKCILAAIVTPQMISQRPK